MIIIQSISIKPWEDTLGKQDGYRVTDFMKETSYSPQLLPGGENPTLRTEKYIYNLNNYFIN